MHKKRLFEIGLAVLVAGAITSVIAAIGEINYIQCIASSGAACTSAGSTQYVTVFLANSEMLSVGLSVALIGAILLIGGSITGYVAKLGEGIKSGSSPLRLCPKCGTQLAPLARLCPNCGNKLED